ncbi:MAG TPA: hypothetical protein VG713_05150 [Pirellulales bacterium]|nr:hypothetical protein [Pirellulales bacterium]
MDNVPKVDRPAEASVGEGATPAGRFTMKTVSLWLAGPSALLVFINQIVPLWKAFKEPAGAENQATVVVEHRLPQKTATSPSVIAQSLTIEAARFTDTSGDKIELVCRNSAEAPAFVKQAIVEITRIWKLKPIAVARGQLASSAEYDLTLPPDAASNSASTTVSRSLNQEIPASGLDRFTLSLGVAASNEQCARVYQFRLKIVSGDATIDAGEFVYLSAPADGPALPPYSINRAAAAEIGEATGTRNAAVESFLAPAK